MRSPSDIDWHLPLKDHFEPQLKGGPDPTKTKSFVCFEIAFQSWMMLPSITLSVSLSLSFPRFPCFFLLLFSFSLSLSHIFQFFLSTSLSLNLSFLTLCSCPCFSLPIPSPPLCQLFLTLPIHVLHATHYAKASKSCWSYNPTKFSNQKQGVNFLKKCPWKSLSPPIFLFICG